MQASGPPRRPQANAPSGKGPVVITTPTGPNCTVNVHGLTVSGSRASYRASTLTARVSLEAGEEHREGRQDGGEGSRDRERGGAGDAARGVVAGAKGLLSVDQRVEAGGIVARADGLVAVPGGGAADLLGGLEAAKRAAVGGGGADVVAVEQMLLTFMPTCM